MNQQRIPRRTREEWEDWEDSDEEPLAPQRTRDGPSSSGAGRSAPRAHRTSISASTTTGDRIRRLKSRQRQKAQNQQAGIKLVTDMSRFREQRQSRTGKFVDAAALKALEGSNSADAAGGFSWRKKKAAQAAKGKMPDRLGVDTPVQDDLSPSAGPIMIGFAMPSDSEVIVSPQTVTVETPMDFARYFGKPAPAPVQTQQPVSAWSPDTPDSHGRPSIIGETMRSHVPAVPSVPMAYRGPQASGATGLAEDDGGYKFHKTPRNKRETKGTIILLSDDESDASTPITLFEEDVRPKGRNRASTAASLRSTGWWDQVTTPFVKTPDTPQDTVAREAKDWWSNTDRKQPQVLAKVQPQAETKAQPQPQSRTPASINLPPRITIEAASPPPPISPQPSLMPSPRGQGQRRARTSPAPAEHEEPSHPTESPPPYSPPPAQTKESVRYRAVFPPNHPLNSMYPPSPGPLSPGLSRTMTSQGAIGLTNIPLTPATTEPVMAYPARLPDRPMGSFVPQTTFDPPPGSGPRQKVERQRRRHEKEDAMAYKAGGLWKGRGCAPKWMAGCFGRPGPEGRKHRRVCGLVFCILVVLVVVAIVVPVVVLRGRTSAAAPQSIFVNLTTFPPMPTGVLTVIGTDSDATTNCITPPTMWSCALPKEKAALAAPYDNTHPTFILQIQFDNDTRQLWNIPDGVPPQRPPPTNGFTPSPPPPSFQEMFFLGNTTDGVVSPFKAGEPTPFYLSVLQSLPPTLTRRRTDTLTRRQTDNQTYLVPPPRLDPLDGVSGAPAELLPFPVQQPLRLYDRGLPTERYAFYTYYDKSTYLKSILPLDKTGASNPGPVPADLDGGSLRSEANFIITWQQARYKIEIWTRREGSARLLADATPGGTRPGTFPFPITVTLDTHGGEYKKKFGFLRPVDERGRIVEGKEFIKFLGNDMNTKGDLVNPAGEFKEGFGGMDGGTGGISRPYSTPPRPLLTLAIETSCDDTCVAVLEKSGPAARLLFNKKVTSDHRRFGGVHPAAAVVGHDAALATLVQEAIHTGHPTARRPPDFVTATRGPGMSANLSVGLNTAKGLACAWNVPLLGVHHMQAHALTPRLVSALALPFPSTTTTTSPDTPPSPPSPPSPSFPFLTLLISGGHTLLLHSHSLTSHSLLATTPSHAIGNMLDAASRLILPPSLLAASPTTNYAAALETFAFPTPDYTTYTPPPTRAAEIAPYVSTTGGGWHLTPPLSQSRRMEFNFTGLGSQVAPALRSVSDDDEAGRRELAFAVQKVAFEQLASRVVFALDELNPHPASARLARILDAAATLMRRLCRSSCSRHCMPSHASQYWQSAAPPAMVPSRSLLISITFLTVCEAIQLPAVARESVATMMPPWKRKASVVVPWAILMGHEGLERSSEAARSHAEGWGGRWSVGLWGRWEGQSKTYVGHGGHGELEGEAGGAIDEILVLVVGEEVVLVVSRAAVLRQERVHCGWL
ncbi:hypothetical protein QBC39DRAFT_387567 [Podospora conica]|nr:hypothetical protein QBC39DRAFT_387567 [Schizothecium conicum]